MSAAAEAIRWIEGREPGAPASLRRRMAEALEAVAEPPAGGGTEGIALLLAEAAAARLRVVLAAPGARAAALDLLAADALLTYACEAAAESGPEALAAVARACGPDRLAGMLSIGSP